MKMETLKVDVTGKTEKNMDFKNISMKIKMETFSLDVTGKTIFYMDFVNLSIKTEKQNQLNNM
jgi:hypothetical protein